MGMALNGKELMKNEKVKIRQAVHRNLNAKQNETAKLLMLPSSSLSNIILWTF
jgi:hypothetical protein